VPLLSKIGADSTAEVRNDTVIVAHWPLGDSGRLTLVANLGDAPVDGVDAPEGELIFETAPSVAADLKAGRIGAWAVACHASSTGAA
jgi:maltooligosyltrehalose trehalohydrolase